MVVFAGLMVMGDLEQQQIVFADLVPQLPGLI
jgi:hypothetical protein